MRARWALLLGALAAAVGWLGPFVGRVTRIWLVPEVFECSTSLRVGLLGTAGISRFAVIYPARRRPCDVAVVAVASRDADRAAAFASAHGIPSAFGSYDDLINSDTVDAVYVAVPTRQHYYWAARCIAGGKHVLVEKPLASNSTEAAALVDAARNRGVVLFEGYHYRHHGAAKRLAEVVASGGVGAVQRVDVEFSLPSLGSWWASIRPPRAVPPDLDEHLRYKMLDRWCYCVDSAVWIARAAGLRDGVTVESAVATHGSFEAVLSAASAGGLPIDFRLTASKDRLEVPRWDVTVTGVSGSCRVVNIGFPFLYHRVVVNETENTFYGEGETTFEYQLEAFVAAIKGVGFLSDEDGHEREHQLLQTMRAVDASVVKADLPPFISWRPERQ